jgi:hypothetical protein
MCGGTCADLASDPQNCGTCGNGCPHPTLQCTCGVCVEPGSFSAAVCPKGLAGSAVGDTLADAIAVDGSGVYFATTSAIMKVGLGGGTPVTVVATTDIPYALAVRGSTIYWTENPETGAAAISSVHSAPITGGASQTLVPYMPLAMGIAADATNVYVGNYNGIVIAPESIGSAKTIVTSQGNTNNVYCVAVDATNAYAAEYGGYLWKIPLNGTAPVMLSGDPSGGLVVSGSTLYFTDDPGYDNAGSIWAVNTTTADAPTKLATDLEDPGGLATDGTYVYALTAVSIVKAPLAGGDAIGVVPINGSAAAALSIAVDATSVYWIADGVVWSAPK